MCVLKNKLPKMVIVSILLLILPCKIYALDVLVDGLNVNSAGTGASFAFGPLNEDVNYTIQNSNITGQYGYGVNLRGNMASGNIFNLNVTDTEITATREASGNFYSGLHTRIVGGADSNITLGANTVINAPGTDLYEGGLLDAVTHRHGTGGDVNYTINGAQINAATQTGVEVYVGASFTTDNILGFDSDVTFNMVDGTINAGGYGVEVVNYSNFIQDEKLTTFNMSGGEINAGATGVRVQNSRFRDQEAVGSFDINLSGGSINVTGDSAYGLDVSSGSSQVGSTNNTLDITGGQILVNATGQAVGTSVLSGNAPEVQVTFTGGQTRINGSTLDSVVHSVLTVDPSKIIYDGAEMVIDNVGDGIKVVHVVAPTDLDQDPGTYDVDIISGAVISGNDSLNAAIRVASIQGGSIFIGSNAIVDGSRSGIAIRDGDGGYRQEIDGIDDTPGTLSVLQQGQVIGNVILGLEDDVYTLSSGSFTGDLYGDDPVPALAENNVTDGNDSFNIEGGAFIGSAFLGGGDDTFSWSSGSVSGGIYGEDGSDMFLVSSSGYDGSQVLDGGDDASTEDGFVDVLTLQNLNVDAIGANIRNFEVVNIQGGRVGFSDNQLTAGDVFVTNSGRLDAGMMFTLTGNLTTQNEGVFDITGGGSGVFEVTGNVTNNGIIDSQDSATGDTLNIAGNYSGSGRLLSDINTDTNEGDLLNISGDANGVTLIGLNDIGSGQGQETGDGLGAGIALVSIGGDVASEAFAIENGELLVGPYRYTLNLESDNTFYLQSELLQQVVTQRDMAFSMVNTVSVMPPAMLRHNILNSTLNSLASFNSRDSLNSRLSDCAARAGNEFEVNQEDCRNSYNWIRLEHSDLDFNPPSKDYRQSSFDERRNFVHFGFDKELNVNKGKRFEGGEYMSRWLIGVNGHVGESDTSVKRNELQTAGVIEKDFQGIGLNATRYSNDGWYQDYVLQLSKFDGEINSVRGQTSVDGTNIALSAEAGKTLHPWGKDSAYSITPQAQVILNKSGFESYQDPDGIDVHLKDGETTTARLGVLMQWQKPQTDEVNYRDSAMHIGASIYSNLDNKTSILAEGVELSQEDHDAWLGLRSGGRIEISQGLSVYGELGYRQSLDDFGDSREFNGNIGLRKAFSSGFDGRN